MKLRSTIVTITLLALLMAAFSFTGCNTWEGAGNDVERTGEKMQGDD